MTRMAGAAVAGAVLLLAGCAEQLVELPTDHRPAAVVELGPGPLRCPSDTVATWDESAGSGAGAVPADFDGRSVLRCVVDYTRSRSRDGVEQVPVSQWQAARTPELRAAFDLPDREQRPPRACAAATGYADAVYLVDARRRAIRVTLPYDDPCRRMRAEVSALLPGREPPAEATFFVSREGR